MTTHAATAYAASPRDTPPRAASRQITTAVAARPPAMTTSAGQTHGVTSAAITATPIPPNMTWKHRTITRASGSSAARDTARSITHPITIASGGSSGMR